MDPQDRRNAETKNVAGIADPMLCDPWSFVKEDDRNRIKQWGGDAFELRRRVTDHRDAARPAR